MYVYVERGSYHVRGHRFDECPDFPILSPFTNEFEAVAVEDDLFEVLEVGMADEIPQLSGRHHCKMKRKKMWNVAPRYV